MGKAKWFGAVKKVFSPESKKKKHLRSKVEQLDTSTSESFEAAVAAAPPPPATPPRPEPVKAKQPVAPPPPPTVAPVPATEPEVRPTALSRLTGEAKEAAAATKIQTAFRGYLARRALRALRGLVRLKSLIHGNSVKRQATTTLRCMQTLARVQSQIRSRRIRMSEENQALQRQLLMKRERELEILRMGDDWDDSLQSKEQIEASLTNKQEAAIRRERALAYAFSHQWKNSSKSANPLFMDPNNPHWGWSWMERWMAARPWESRIPTDKDFSNEHASAKSTGGEIMSSYARRDTNSDKPSPATSKQSRQSPATPPSRAPSMSGRAVKSASPRASWPPPEDDTRSTVSIQSERYRRHSVAGSSVRDDESVASLASSPAVPSYMAPTKSARARTRFQSELAEKIEEVTPERVTPVGSAKKRLSFPMGEKHGVPSPAVIRRHSGPPKVDGASVKIVPAAVYAEQNGGSR